MSDGRTASSVPSATTGLTSRLEVVVSVKCARMVLIDCSSGWPLR